MCRWRAAWPKVSLARGRLEVDGMNRELRGDWDVNNAGCLDHPQVPHPAGVDPNSNRVLARDARAHHRTHYHPALRHCLVLHGAWRLTAMSRILVLELGQNSPDASWEASQRGMVNTSSSPHVDSQDGNWTRYVGSGPTDPNRGGRHRSRWSTAPTDDRRTVR